MDYSKNKMITGSLKFASSAAGFTGVVGVMVPGLGIAMAITGIVFTAVASGLDKTSKIQTKAFDNYFNFEDFYQRVKAGLASKGRKIYDEDAYKTQLRNRLASAAGYSSVASANVRIGQQYARMILERLFNPTEKWEKGEKEAYIQMVKSFGLPYDPEKRLPEMSDLAKKMSGR